MFNSQFFFTHGFKINSEEKNILIVIITSGGHGSLLTFFYLSVFHSVGASIIQKPSSVIVEEGQPTPTVTWRKAVGHMSNERSRVFNGRLEITNVTKTDGGDYICSAENIINEDSAHIQVTVFEQPKFTLLPPHKRLASPQKMCY